MFSIYKQEISLRGDVGYTFWLLHVTSFELTQISCNFSILHTWIFLSVAVLPTDTILLLATVISEIQQSFFSASESNGLFISII